MVLWAQQQAALGVSRYIVHWRSSMLGAARHRIYIIRSEEILVRLISSVVDYFAVVYHSSHSEVHLLASYVKSNYNTT